MMAANKVVYEEGLLEKLESARKMKGTRSVAQLDETSGNQSIPLTKWYAGLQGLKLIREIDDFLLPKTPLTVIFGPPSSGKSKQLLQRINQLVDIARQSHNEYGILLLHMGSALCQKDTLDRLSSNPINMLDIERVKSLSPVEMIKYGGVARVQWKCHCSIIHIYVDDYCIEAVDAEKEIEEWTRALEELTRATLTLTLTVVFQTHSRGGREISMEKLISFFQDRNDSKVIKLHEPGTSPDCCTSKQLLHHIYNNETCNPLQMAAKTLPTGSRPGAWVIGSKPKRISMKYLCPGSHLDLSCKGQECCLPYIGAYVCFLSALSQEILGEVVYVLMPDRKLMNFLQTISGEHARRLHFFHPEEFRGCESSVTITVNVDDSWILESLSRAKTHLYIIDCLPEHQQVWRTMQEEGRIEEEVLTHNVPLESGILLSLNNIGKFLIFDCPKCEEFSHLGLLSVYRRRGKLDIREHLKVYKGERPPEEIASAYVSQDYPEAYVKSYSLPEGFILSDNKFNDLKTKAFKGKEDVSLPLDQLSIAVVFDRVKHALKDVPSLIMADYEFTDTFFKGINQQQKDHFIKNFGVTTKDLETGCHGVFGIGISGKDIVGLFFQVKATTSNANHKTILDSLAKAMKQVNKDFNVFRVVCGNFLNSIVKLAGFVALPMLPKSKLQKEIKCKECRARILTSEDLDGPGSFTTFLDRQGIVLEKTWDRNPESLVLKTFKEIFDLYVYAASGLDLPRNQTQLLIKSEGQMKKMSEILTPKQRESVMSKEKFMFICGAHGTGKTFLIRERATELAKTGKVLVVNLAGGLLTEEYQRYFRDEEEIQVIDGRDEALEENIGALKKYLLEKGKNKNILIDEVPITLGFQDIITPEAVTKHWECILDEINQIKSMTVSFRPIDQSYTRDIPLLDVKPRGCQIKILEEVKRNSRKIAELLMAIRCFFSRNVLSLEKTVRMDIDESAGGFLPALHSIPSCSSLHPSKCQEKMICEAVRASHAIDSIRNQCSISSKERPLFVVVDSEKRKNALVNIIMSFFPSIPFLFFSNRRRIWRGNGNLNGSSSLVIVTEHEMMGCYPKNVIIILDFPFTQWKNYNRLIPSTLENKILVTEEEELRTGKFSRLTKEIFGWKIKEGNIDGADLSRILEKAWQAYDNKKIEHLKDDAFSRSRFPGMDIDSDGKDEQKIADVDRMLKSWLSGIFGFPASGKSSRIDILIRNVTESSDHLILLHCGSDLSWEAYRERWGNEDHVKLAYLDPSKIKTGLVIIDNIPNHQHLWDTMTQEGRVEAVHDTFPSYSQEYPKILLRLDEKERFLKGPTWDETAKRVGKEALGCGFLNETTGAIQNIPPETWATLDHSSKTLHSSSPFQDWGYVYNCESPGSVTQADEEERKKILEILLQMRVKWEDEKLAPVPLKMSGEGGVLESLSLSLTGSLLHLSLLQNILAKKNFEDPLPLLQSGADHFHRPIVLIGEKLFRIFIPSGVEQAENEWRGILLFAQDFRNGSVLPVVPNSGHVWMEANTLPKVWKDKMPKSLERISFRGTIDVDWRAHTVPLMWALDRCLVDLLPLSPEELQERGNRH
ncbi:unnamed protein product [Darwinula stevensoni]|uniref:Uncharacterized protein n=1 Tax=Darwinula stevensoni TaxID=69355 RepID=A0A7R9A9F0_9CRUS|nr:unnamed protein product [Darwinula stevensoni]CAG0897331.1 unnamed protein product [Darwinula stevensoni]